MANIKNRALFFTTSPRTPAKMIPEIQLLAERFAGQPWNTATQSAFMEELAKSEFFEGVGSMNDKAVSARDRINRAPKSLGFVALSPCVSLTPAGEELVYGARPQEIFLRQLLKYQLPSPYHIETPALAGTFWVRPYLEMFRLVRKLEYLTFDELKIFALQLTDYRKFDEVLAAILEFRHDKTEHRGEYKLFADAQWTQAVLSIYADDVAAGTTRTRETEDASLKKFVQTKKANLRDYADACFRYLRFTGLVSVSHKGKSISIAADKLAEVDYILETVERNPVFADNEDAYRSHLFDETQPMLAVDMRENIVEVILRFRAFTKRELAKKTLDELKSLRDDLLRKKKDAAVEAQIKQLKSYAFHSEIIETFHEITQKNALYDAPLVFEWNTWRAMTMLDGGRIQGNFRADDAGLPMCTAQGNMPDIECDYGDFMLSVEVTLQSGQRQYETEGEPVARHYGQMLKRTGKDSYCLFIAPKLNPASLAHFYMLNKTAVSYYGGKAKIIPLELAQFIRLVEYSYAYNGPPKPADVKAFLDEAILCKCRVRRTKPIGNSALMGALIAGCNPPSSLREHCL